MVNIKSGIFLILNLFCAFILNAQNKKESYRFDFGTGGLQKDYLQILPNSAYSTEVGYGFLDDPKLIGIDNGGENPLTTDFITSSKPFVFAVDVPEGNYDVTVYFGDEQGASSQTVRAECRRLMIEPFKTAGTEVVKKQFTVHVKTAIIAPSGDSVKLKKRELDYLHWDNHLSIEFNGDKPKVCGLEITKNNKATTIFLAGNSTVVDQAEEPYASWGQMIPAFFKPGEVVFANYAESGETLLAFENERRLEKILSQMKKGDYLFIEFGHNDQKPGGGHLDPFTTYKEKLKYYVSEVRKKGGNPVLVTSMHRRNFDGSGLIVNTLEDYPEAVRQTGKEENVPVIDLNEMSKKLYEAWGVEKSLKAFVYYPAGTFPGQDQELKDDTHFSPYGAYELAKCVVEGIKKTNLKISKYILSDFKSFDPSKPDPIESFVWPLSPKASVVKPDGN
jgi:lysophospholipase L1-like esterase